jgi:hypothetical protein
MTAFLITQMVLLMVSLGGTSFNLQCSYPRQRNVSRTEDLIGLFIQVGMLVWVINLLLAMP